MQPLPTPNCPLCRDRKWITGVDEHGEKTARRCSCATQSSLGERIEKAGIPLRYRSCNLDGFHTSASRPEESQALVAAKARSQRYVEGFLELEGGFREAGLLFQGKPGTGKTHLAVAVLRELMEHYGVQGLFVDFGSLIEEIQASFDPRNMATKHTVLQPVQNAEVLVLDELGVRKSTPFVSDVLYAVINERYKNRQPTIFTTNYPVGTSQARHVQLDRGADESPAEMRVLPLEQRIPEMLYSRLFEMAAVISMAGAADYRREIGAHRNAL